MISPKLDAKDGLVENDYYQLEVFAAQSNSTVSIPEALTNVAVSDLTKIPSGGPTVSLTVSKTIAQAAGTHYLWVVSVAQDVGITQGQEPSPQTGTADCWSDGADGKGVRIVKSIRLYFIL